MPNHPKKPLHPGARLVEEYLTPFEISQAELARGLDTSTSSINDLIKGYRALTARIALRLGKFFREPAEKFMMWQVEFDLEQAMEEFKSVDVKPFSRRKGMR